MMTVDGLTAMALFVIVSVLRFGADWQGEWQSSVGLAWLLLVGYAVTWVALLGLYGSYRPRTHWSAQGEAAAIVRATMILGLVSLSALFLLDLVDVSRLVIVVLLPLQAITTILFRAGLRSVLGAVRRQGRNLRRVIVVGTGPAALAFARQLEDHWSLGLIVDGLVGPVPDEPIGRWAVLGPIDQLPSILHDRVVDEVAISLPPDEAYRLKLISRLAATRARRSGFRSRSPRSPWPAVTSRTSTGRRFCRS